MKALNEAERWIVTAIVQNQGKSYPEAIEIVKKVLHEEDTTDPERVQSVYEEVQRLWTETIQPLLRSVGLLD